MPFDGNALSFNVLLIVLVGKLALNIIGIYKVRQDKLVLALLEYPYLSLTVVAVTRGAIVCSIE